ncbi:MAG: AAA family ATPase [Myxococcota bacterium]
MKITRVHVEGFRSLRDVTFEPGPVTVLIGANGSGKSNLLRFLEFASTLGILHLQSSVAAAGGASALLYRGKRTATEIRLGFEWERAAGQLRYDAVLMRRAEDQMYFENESVTPSSDGARLIGTIPFESRLVMTAGDVDIPERQVVSALHAIRVFHVHDTSDHSPLRDNAFALRHRELATDGDNLAAYLLWLKHSSDRVHQASWALFMGLLRRVAPFISDIQPVPVNVDPATFRFDDPHGKLDKVYIRLEWLDEYGNRFGVSQLSDGTLRAMALFAALTQPTLPSFICIDEPELGLHPAALNILVGLIRSVSTRCQVLVATQSPTLLDHFSPEEVVVAERIDGATQLRRLDSDKLASWLEDYSLSELYEKNVLGGRP